MAVQFTQDIADQVPPMVPQDETPVADDAAFLSDCRVQLGDTSGWTMGNTLLTNTDQWGLIWRADFTDHETTPGNLSRVVCWHESETDRWFIMFFRNRPMEPL